MGVKDLFKVVHNGIRLRDMCREITKLDFTDLTGYTFYIDASNFMHRNLQAFKLYHGEHRVSHIHILLLLYKQCVEYNISLVFVYDPVTAPLYKKKLIEERMSDPNRSVITDHEREIFSTVVKFLGITEIRSKDIEAEHLACILSRLNKMSLVYSHDSDTLMYGGDMIKNEHGIYVIYYLDKILETFELTRTQFIQVCLTLGMDYYPGIKGIGPKTVIKKIKSGSIEFDDEFIRIFNYVTTVDSDYYAIYTEANLTEAKNFLSGLGFTPENSGFRYIANAILSEW